MDRSWCEQALEEVRKIVGDDRPLTEWVNDHPGKLNLTDAHPGRWHYPFFQDPGRTGWTPQNPVLETLYDQPRLRAALDRMHGGLDAWDGARNYYIFLNPYNPEAEARIEPKGHIDFKPPIPALYRGFTFQVALIDTEPFSGNTTIYPGTHVPVQKALMADRDRALTQADEALTGPVEPYEFVAEAGDVLFMHHLVYHSGNPSHAPNRKPRLGLHAESFRKTQTRPATASPCESRSSDFVIRISAFLHHSSLVIRHSRRCLIVFDQLPRSGSRTTRRL